MKKDKSRYFGPFTSAGAVKDTIELVCGIFKIRNCSKVLPRDIGKERPCLNYHIGRCDCPCAGLISKEEYRNNVNRAMEFLSGKQEEVIAELEGKMNVAAMEMRYEDAANYRDLIVSVKHVAGHQKITTHQFEDRDIIACATDRNEAVVQVFFVRDGKLIGREHFYLTVNDPDENIENKRKDIITNFIKQYYGGTPYIPHTLLVQTDVEDREVLELWLKNLAGFKVSIVTPKKGDKEKMVELAARNADMVLVKDREKLIREEKRTVGATENIAKMLNISSANRMEAYDISNTNGFESVGSMIVYEMGKPKRNNYRKFRIKWVKGANDYKSMEEVLTRRFSRGLEERENLKAKGMEYENGSFSKFPDLIMMDGGRGQVNVAKEVLDKLHLDIPVCGMVKDDKHNTRGLYFNNIEIPIEKSSEEFRLITRIQDEAHRFAIEYHKSLRSKKAVHSILDDIESIGPARRKALMKRFNDIEGVKGATLKELASCPSMNMAAAVKVYDFFHD
jgi:excinuclease ABC subunit C